MFSTRAGTEAIALLNDSLSSVKGDIKTIIARVANTNDMCPSISSRMVAYYSDCLDYNIVGGKLARARTVLEAHAMCTTDAVSVDSPQVKAAVVFGWAVEILQAFFLIEDDVMDKGEVRRGRPCWYHVPTVGIANAINDGLLLEQVLYELISTNPNTKQYEHAAHSILRQASMRTVLGQHLDTHPPESVLDFTRAQWLSVVRFKTAFYTFTLPCELGILVSGRKFSESDLSKFRSVGLLVGELFQAQDDMLDSFGTPELIGKVGRDIEEGKCTWLWYTAMELVAQEDFLKQELVTLYSSSERAVDPEVVRRVKQIYKQVGVENEFQTYSGKLADDIRGLVNQISAPELQTLGTWLLTSTQHRKK